MNRAHPSRWRAVIADDEPLAREVIRGLLADRPEVTVVAECRTGLDVIQAVAQLHPDLLFLDVAMPDLDGLAALERLDPRSLPVTILVTAFDHFALRAFDHAALDYLVKPFTDARFELAVERACTRLTERAADPGRYRRRFLVQDGARTRTIQVDEVHWIEARNYCARLHLGDGFELIRRSLARLERELDPGRFLRIHRGAIVNIAQASELHRGPAGLRLRLSDGTSLPVSSRRAGAVLDRMGRDRPAPVPVS